VRANKFVDISKLTHEFPSMKGFTKEVHDRLIELGDKYDGYNNRWRAIGIILNKNPDHVRKRYTRVKEGKGVLFEDEHTEECQTEAEIKTGPEKEIDIKPDEKIDEPEEQPEEQSEESEESEPDESPEESTIPGLEEEFPDQRGWTHEMEDRLIELTKTHGKKWIELRKVFNKDSSAMMRRHERIEKELPRRYHETEEQKESYARSKDSDSNTEEEQEIKKDRKEETWLPQEEAILSREVMKYLDADKQPDWEKVANHMMRTEEECQNKYNEIYEKSITPRKDVMTKIKEEYAEDKKTTKMCQCGKEAAAGEDFCMQCLEAFSKRSN